MGSEIEANPLVRYTLKQIGLLPGLVILKGAGISLGIFIYIRLRMQPKLTSNNNIINLLIIVVFILYVCVNISNWYLVYYVLTA